jgi:imidazolonepropionase-like amidohydrolase
MPAVARALLLASIAVASAPASLAAQASATACRPAARDTARSWSIAHVAVVDVVRGTVLRDRTVEVRGRCIVAVRPAVDARPAPGATVVDGRGRYLLPGLWDMHAHVDDGGAWQLPAYLALGVTGLRDMGSALPHVATWRRAWRDDALAPQVVAAGPIVFGDGDDPDPRVAIVRTAAGARALVDSLARSGVDFLKIYDWLPRPAFRALADAARARGLPIAGHLPLAVDPAEAVRAGQRSIEHFGNAEGGLLLHASSAAATLVPRARAWVGRPFDPRSHVAMWAPAAVDALARSYRPARVAALARLLARDSVFLTPTLFSTRAVSPPFDARIADDARRALLPTAWRAQVDAQLADARRAPAPPERVRAQDTVVALAARLTRDLRRGGVALLAGSDLSPWPGAYPGHALHDELEALVRAGIPTTDALRAATWHPARYLRATDSLGTVAAGRRADLVLLDGDPIADIRNTRRVAGVAVRGRWLGPAALDSLLAVARAAAAR